MNWYENPTIAAIIGGVVGAAITAAASIFIWQKTSRVRRIDCVINDASSLLTFSDTIRSKLEVKYAGEQTTSVFLFNLEVFNSGNQAVGNQPVLVRLDNNAKIVGYSIKTEPEVGFGKISELQRQNSELDLSIELLNPGDRVYLELISVNNTSDLIEVYMKNANVICRSYTRKAAESAILGVLSKSVDPTLVSLAMMRSIPFFGGFMEPFMTVVLAERFERALRQRK
ncbi:hypothetical protein ACN23B_11030 [Anabaena sp. FACHB-709]|uniref:Uncharacterized protein n=2 Tax=Nostocaceae TaxID=1162 RepID=A0A1Z4KFR9_ANAVA|nr:MULTISPECIES: hypothetical protein [Nostocaceae]BAY67821.1 hypothetical protein NIES23_06030 [Trichormus variabilis NIES-23]HBW29572.1 hypothetical protein [Nostoc sp. UBA8866]MBD2170087.1 hypothetical protein [Anabaena cylindrica FACHB-318]MBD2261492.1 hypothetical protein [Anabaena sp. FACHB-709]MBD2271076.1 hypothetical protein [Nostoc sp. PCC 7120 = FACHB-418]